MYKLIKNPFGELNIVLRLFDNASIPFSSDNTDYQRFKKDLVNGAELQDATGNVMTSQAVTEFLQGLQ